jgi:hypothetical protein
VSSQYGREGEGGGGRRSVRVSCQGAQSTLHGNGSEPVHANHEDGRYGSCEDAALSNTRIRGACGPSSTDCIPRRVPSHRGGADQAWRGAAWRAARSQRGAP